MLNLLKFKRPLLAAYKRPLSFHVVPQTIPVSASRIRKVALKFVTVAGCLGGCALYGISLSYTGRSGTYKGEKWWELRHGKGTMKYDDHASYDSMWAFGVWYGLGTRTYYNDKNEEIRVTCSWTGLFEGDWARITTSNGATLIVKYPWFGPAVVTEVAHSNGSFFEGQLTDSGIQGICRVGVRARSLWGVELRPEVYFEGNMINDKPETGVWIRKFASGKCEEICCVEGGKLVTKDANGNVIPYLTFPPVLLAVTAAFTVGCLAVLLSK